ncbi:HAD family hydrolase [Peribacillus simplex]|nr:HAD family hydrolase [Peribacillus simplex]
MIKAVIFDMDDTLFEEREYVLSGFSAVDEHLKLKSINGFHEKAVQLFESDVRENLFNKVLDSLNVSYDKDYILSLVEVYRNHKPKINMFEDAKWVINTLISSYNLGLITDGYLNAQKNKTKTLGLESYFDVIIFTDQFGREHWKPSQTPYLEIMKYFQLEAHELIYIGDNPTKDFITAKKIGWKTVYVKREIGEYLGKVVSSEYEADHQIKTLYDLPELLY